MRLSPKDINVFSMPNVRIHPIPTEPKTNDDDDDQTSGVTELPEASQQRIIFINRPQPQKFCTNKISTAKYSMMSFLPKFLFEQFRRYSNIFFLFIALLQQIPNVSPTGRYTTAVPLIFIFTVSALKEVIEDYKRHRADDIVNNTEVLVFREGTWKSLKWTQVAVGDILKVSNSQSFPADMVLLSSSEPQGICYIETANLDGETNLKIRQGIPETARVLTTDELQQFIGTLECELPNKALYEFAGNVRLFGKQAFPLGPDQVLLRGAKLKNTTWIFGIVIYTGHETKLMMASSLHNSLPAPLKRSTVDKLTNMWIILLFILLVILCLISSVASELWTSTRLKTDWYLGLDDLSSVNFGYNFLTFIILFNNLIPISLQVTLEVVRFIQAIFINMDLDMYHEASDTPAMARTSNLNEELGQVKYIFSDKTGTLTRNIMEFKLCSIAGKKYGDESGDSFETLIEEMKSGKASSAVIKDFLILLSVCHTVVPERSREDENVIYYQAASPDEGALVRGAKKLGFAFNVRTPKYAVVDVLGVEERYEILNVLEFTSSRKRMSVVIRNPDGQLKLYCKGADTVIYERLGDNQQYKDLTLKQLEEFAVEGLRTLCCAMSDITEEFYEEWKQTYYKASISVQYRERKLEEAAQLIESNLVLLGASAIEDKLQDGVPEAIASLLKADIRVWVLTGDKQETAINIGHSSHLLQSSMPLIIINEDSLDSTREVIHRHVHEFGDQLRKDNEVALVIDGKSLTYALTHDIRTDFLDLAISCKSVICCRVSPIQKSEVVELVKKSTIAVTLAIGDGANDVAMIQAAHVGVGISGMEGLQAACASDYSIAQFRYLNKLLFVHGAWSYDRLCKLILYSFHKNICLYVIELWFSIMSGWSGQTLFERWTIGLYNVIFTAAPPLVMGLFDRMCSAETMMKFPALYKPSQCAQLFNVKIFLLWIIDSIYHSILLFWLTMFAMNQDVAWKSGREGGYLVFGNMVYTYVVVTVCLKAGLEMNAWTWVTHLAIWGSIASWFLFLLAYSNFWPVIPVAPDMCGMHVMVYASAVFWMGLIIIPFLTLLADISVKIIRRTMCKTLGEAVRESEITNVDPSKVVNKATKPRLTETARLLKNVKNAFKRPTRTPLEVEMQHGYAFSQEEHGAFSQVCVVLTGDFSEFRYRCNGLTIIYRNSLKIDENLSKFVFALRSGQLCCPDTSAGPRPNQSPAILKTPCSLVFGHRAHPRVPFSLNTPQSPD
uniref:Phospholipid-transporting ATPase n=1 Tax=Strigamia maritima TaxID=126957 RepID=T1JKU3_STRMM